MNIPVDAVNPTFLRGLMKSSRPRSFLLLSAFTISLIVGASIPCAYSGSGETGSGDWPRWGGTPDRNMVSAMKDLPTTWDIGKKTNVKWVAALGSQSYGNPVVSGGQVFLGTNNEGLRDPKQGGDRGVLMAVDEQPGE